MSIALTVKQSGIVVYNFPILVKYHPSFSYIYQNLINNFKVFASFLFFSSRRVYWMPSFKNISSIRKKSVVLLGTKRSISCFKNLIFIQKKKEKQLSIFVKSLSNKHERELFHRYNFRNTYLKEYLLVAASIISIERLKNMCKCHSPN